MFTKTLFYKISLHAAFVTLAVLTNPTVAFAADGDTWFVNSGRIFLTIGALFIIAGYVLGKAGVIQATWSPDSKYGLGNALPVLGLFLIALWLYLDTQNDWAKLGKLLNVIDWVLPGE